MASDRWNFYQRMTQAKPKKITFVHSGMCARPGDNRQTKNFVNELSILSEKRNEDINKALTRKRKKEK